MRVLNRLLQRLVILGLGIVSVWLIVFVVFDTADRRLPWILAAGLTYAIAAYVILPRIICMGLKLLHRKRVPSFTTTGDGLPGDPVNVALVGNARTASRGVRRPRLVGSRPAWPRQLLGHDPGLRVQRTLSHRPVQHPLSVWPRPRHWVPEGDRQQPSQTPPYPVLVLEPREGRGDLGRGCHTLLAEHRPTTG